jgi:N-acetylneuraminate synthase
MPAKFAIGNFLIGEDLDPYIIAEIGVNHEGDVALAKQLVDQAARAGAHAAKFQTYKADKIASKHSPAYWDTTKEPTRTQHELFQKFDTFEKEDYEDLAHYCESKGIHFMSTPFDLDAVEFLTPLVPAFKIASADITNVPLIRKCSATGKPLIISTGASTLPEIEFAVQTASAAGAKNISLLHCVLNYPTPVDNANLNAIKDLKRVFPEVMIGYSDHVVPDKTISALEVASLLGAAVLEKHFTHNKELPGNDHYHAMDENDLEHFVKKLALYRRLSNKGQNDLTEQAAARQHARRSVVAARPIRSGERLSEENLIAKRPAHGISPVHWDELIGKTALVDIEEDDLIDWGMLR